MKVDSIRDTDVINTVQDNEVLSLIKQISTKISSELDVKTKKKIDEVVHKWQQQKLNIGFCGHFSAGKSTLINRLLQKPILPTSPIPTSANIVTIQFGSPKAIINMMNGQRLEIDLADIDRWKEYCKDGQLVESIELFDQTTILEDGLQLLDTPGIDSTDVAHQASTEAALHVADVIFFVTDYNHVQSEINFHFIKSLIEKGKVLFLIINQIDKHRSRELSLATFQERVEEGLKSWGIELNGLFFTSLRDSQHPYNQFNQLEQLIEEIKEHKEAILSSQLLHSTFHLVEEHGLFLKEQKAERVHEIEEEIAILKKEVAWFEAPSLLEEYKQSEQAYMEWRREVEHETEKILQSAIITPYTTTQLAQEMIESYQSSFKVGLLFAGSKTEKEKERRVQAFYEELSEKVTSQMEWHVKEALRKKAEKYQLNQTSFKKSLLEWTKEIPIEWLTQNIKQGVVSREYVYNYTKELTLRIQQMYKRQIQHFIAEGEDLLREEHQLKYVDQAEALQIYQRIEGLESELSEIDMYCKQQVRQLQESLIEEISRNEQKMEFWTTREAAKQSIDNLSVQQSPEHLEGMQGSIYLDGKEAIKHKVASKQDDATVHARASVTRAKKKELSFQKSILTRMAERLWQSAERIKGIASLELTRNELLQKAERLKQNRFTICLFGAFSAGKSSFANALLDQYILPVSPNPTTAAINHIVPATKEHPASTALVEMKSKRQIEGEIELALERLQLEQKGFGVESFKQLKKINPAKLRSSLKPYYSFLEACSRGWDVMEEKLGSSLHVSVEAYTQYVAKEELACFVQSIYLYADTPLIQQGIEIIDTPGADSIYARHTNVTFNFIKHADVIIYVTYYNHAFSRADRQFLDQLGRVKDQFAMDKMFFIVNAADLAADKQELQDVVKHVEQNLLQSGIRFPRTFPVSSIRAIEGETESGFETFEESFYSFLQQDLTNLLLDASWRDLEHLQALLQDMLVEMKSSVEEKAQKEKNLRELELTLVEKLQHESYPDALLEISKELKELLYYVQQRLFFQFRSHVNEAFHPSTLSEDQSKKQLKQCLDELIYSLHYQLTDELKATTIRIENFIHRIVDRIYRSWQHDVEELRLPFSTRVMEKMDIALPPIPGKLTISKKAELEQSTKHFKNAKHFFEQNGKESFIADIQPKLEKIVEVFIRKIESDFEVYYHQAWNKVEKELKVGIKQELHRSIATRISAINGEISEEELSGIVLDLGKVLQENREE